MGLLGGGGVLSAPAGDKQKAFSVTNVTGEYFFTHNLNKYSRPYLKEMTTGADIHPYWFPEDEDGIFSLKTTKVNFGAGVYTGILIFN